jgi:gamma-glutamyltranspeptidase/glutathione hydrolase
MIDYTISFNSRRSNIIGRHGAVATSQPLAAQAGLAILRAGGNAIDAAIATAATLCVVEPGMTGLGADAFALIWSAADQKLYGLNASGPAPAALMADHVRSLGHTSYPRHGGLAVTVPGAPAGWATALDRFGTFSLPQLLASAIDYADNGFPVSECFAADWAEGVQLLNRQAESRRVWLRAGGQRAPRTGELFRNPDLAATLKTLAAEGLAAFYEGPIAQQICETVQADGGLLTMADLAGYQPEWVEPLAITYRPGVTFHEIPPNGQGLTALLAQNIVKGYDLAGMGHGSYEYTHLLMEAIKLAFADATTYIADPRQAEIPLAGLLSDSYTAARRSLISSHSALIPTPGQPQQHEDTVYLTVADEAGNMVSWIQSLCGLFGSGLTASGTGVLLQNRASNFSLEPGHRNEAAGGKRPYHTIIPGFICRDGQPWASFGVMGGFMQPQGHLQVGSNLVDFNMSPQAALDAPRFRWQQGKRFAMEEAFGPAMAEEMRRRGHEIMSNIAARDMHYGGGQVILRDLESGVYVAGSEKRNDGVAVAL